MSYSPGFLSNLSGMGATPDASGAHPQWAGQMAPAGVGAQSPSPAGGSFLAPYVSQIGQLFNNPNPFGQPQQQQQPQMPAGQPFQAGWGQGQQGQAGQQFQSGSLPPYLQSLFQMMQGWGQHPQGTATGQGAYTGNAGFSAYDPFGQQFR